MQQIWQQVQEHVGAMQPPLRCSDLATADDPLRFSCNLRVDLLRHTPQEEPSSVPCNASCWSHCACKVRHQPSICSSL